MIYKCRIYFLFALLTGCTPWGITEIGKLHDQKTYAIGSYRVQLNLHEVKGTTRGTHHGAYTRGSEKELWLWCQTDKTAELNLSYQLGEYEKEAAFTKTGWRRFWIDATQIKTIPAELVGILFHEVNTEIAFAGSGHSTITFDSCATDVTVNPNQYFRDRMSRTPPRKDLVRPPFFKKFTPTADNTGGCFDVEPLYLQDQSKLYQLCTTDKGKTWAEPVGASAPAQQKPPESTKS